LRQLPLEQPGRTLRIANGFWLQYDYSVKPPFRAAIETNFEASSQPIDFRLREAAAKLINDWVATKTNNWIRTLVDATALDPDSRMALVNTAWFKADWESPFRHGDTFPEDFFAADGKPRKIPFMHKQEPMRMIAEEDFQAIELPYVGNEMSMILFLPNARDGLASFEKGLTAEKLGGWIQKLRQTTPRYVKLSLPRIALEVRYDLAPPLSAMGMALPFTSRADFSGITAEADLMIGMAVHQTFLLIDEKGTEAAAATALVPVPVSMPPQSLPFRADHPYFLLLHDNRSGAPVFIGRIRTPRTSY
jgi:serine protease inhibitor